jgi:hypothetical protein
MTSFECAQEDCRHSTRTGHAIHRTSPKGGRFIGLCTEHHPNPDPVALMIEDANLSTTKGNSDD